MKRTRRTFPVRSSMLRVMFAAAMAACGARAASGAELAGRVLGDDGRVLAHAVVRILPEPAAGKAVRAETGPDGTFVARDLKAAELTVRISASGYAPATKRHVAAGGKLEVRLVRGFSLRGIVRDLATRQPIGGATVLAWDADAVPFGESACARATTGADGRFVVSDLPRGVVDLEARATDHAAAKEARIAVPPPAPAPGAPAKELTLLLDPAALLTVRLLDPGRNAVPGVDVKAATEAPQGAPAGAPAISTGPGGRFTIRGLAPGTYTIRLVPEGFGDVRKEHVKLEKGKTTDLGTIVVQEQRGVVGRVTDAAGAPVAGAVVAASWTADGRKDARTTKTDAGGRYVLSLPAARIPDHLLARAKGYARSEHEGRIPSDRIVDFVLDRGGSVAGRVELPGGGAPGSLHVSLRPEAAPREDETIRESVDPTGSFRVDDLAPGVYSLEVGSESRARASRSGIRVAAEQTVDVGTITLDAAGGLRGRVLDARNDSPVAGATVRLIAADPASLEVGRTFSGGDGAFTFDGATEGSFVVVVEHPVFSPSRAAVVLRADVDPPELVVKMARGGALTGMVLDGQKQPAANVQIVIAPADGGGARTVATGPDGRYQAENLPPGVYQVTRLPAGGGAGPQDTKSTFIQAEETTTLDFDGSPRITLRGRVYRGETPLTNASLMFFPVDTPQDFVRSCHSDASGAFEIGLDRGGRYTASVTWGNAQGPAGFRSSVTVTLPEQPEVQQDIVLAMSSISGRVTGSEGTGIKGATIVALRDAAGATDPPRASSAQSGDDGSYRIEGVDPGNYRVGARANGYRSAEVYPVTVSDEIPAASADLSLERGWVARGRVVDPQGRGVPNATVVIASPGQAESGTLPVTTDSGGGFKITSPADGPLSVSAVATGWAPGVLDNVGPPTGDDDAPIVIPVSVGGSLRIRVVGKDGAPAPGVRLALRPDPLFPGSDFVFARDPAPPTDADGVTLVPRLVPRDYVITVPGRTGVDPARVSVSEGGQAEGVITLR